MIASIRRISIQLAWLLPTSFQCRPLQHPPRSISELDEIITRPTERVLSAIDQSAGDFIVLGAGGKMGFHISRMLQRGLQELGRESSVTVVSRFSSPDSREPFERLGFEVVAADLSDREPARQSPACRERDLFGWCQVRYIECCWTVAEDECGDAQVSRRALIEVHGLSRYRPAVFTRSQHPSRAGQPKTLRLIRRASTHNRVSSENEPSSLDPSRTGPSVRWFD